MSESALSPAEGHAVGALEASPLGVDSRKLVMWLFIIADAATFAALLFGYGYLRVGSAAWGRPFAFSPTVVNGVIMTTALLTSSLTMLLAVMAAQAGRRGACIRWLLVTAALGIVFAALHLHEWSNLVHEGWSPSKNPTGGPVLFGATFFTVTGLHLLHVVGGVVAILVIATMFGRGRLTAGHVETTGLYWHFVDLVWMFVFPLVYLMSVR
ncbi:MAG: cytochrome c oxidase subunit 3 [Bacillota bacterium]